MKIIAVALIIGSMSHVAIAQSCTSDSCYACSSWRGSYWCSNSYVRSASAAQGGCCAFDGSCPSTYRYKYPLSYSLGCDYSSYPNNNPNFRTSMSAGEIAYVVILIVLYCVNIGAVVRYCQQRGIPPCGYIAIAVFFTWWVWCCLIPAGRRAQVVVIQSSAAYPHQQAYVAQPYGEPSPYGQPYPTQPYGQPQYPQYPPQAHTGAAQPPNPYGQPAPYGQQQAPNPYAAGGAGGDIQKPYGQPAPYGVSAEQVPNPYNQPPNPYGAGGDIQKPY
jgi:hypothetical protein